MTRHSPTPEFRTALEQEIMREMRREAPPIPMRRRFRIHHPALRTAAMLTAALALGALAGAAPAQVQDARNRSSLLTAAQADEQVAAVRYDLARKAFEDARRRFEVGAIGRESLAAAETELYLAEGVVRRNRLNREEIEASSGQPRDDMSAPLVRNRDFVSERLQLDLTAMQQRLALLERARADASLKYSAGVTLQGPVLDNETDLVRANAELKSLTAKLNLRKDFLAGRLSAGEVENRRQLNDLRTVAEVMQAMQARADRRLARLREMQAVGAVDSLEVMRAQVEVLERAQELKDIAARLDLLRRSQTPR